MKKICYYQILINNCLSDLEDGRKKVLFSSTFQKVIVLVKFAEIVQESV